MDAVTDPALLAQLNANDTPAAPPAASLQPVSDPATLAALNSDATPPAAPSPPARDPGSISSYEPTWRDKLALGLGHVLEAAGLDPKAPEVERIISGVSGSTGLGHTDTGLVDITPARIPLFAQEASRDVQAGDYKKAALDAVGAIPNPALGAAADTVVDGGAALASKIANIGPGATGPIADAAKTLGVKIPTVATYGDGPIARNVQNVAGKVAGIPFIGDPLRDKMSTAIDDLGSAADSVTSQYLNAPGTAGLPAAAAANPASVGDTVKNALTEWIKGGQPTSSPAILNDLYTTVGQQIPAAAFAPLPETRKVVDGLLQKDAASASEVSKPAVDMVADALSAPNGLTFQGMKDLRTNIGAQLDGGLLQNAGTAIPALKQIYGGLTKDLDATVAGLGGHQASAAWDHAETVARDFAGKRQTLADIIGVDGKEASEGVVDKLVRFAGSGSAADTHSLALAKQTLGTNWDDVSAAAIQRLGRNQANDFDLGQFTKRYEGLSENGRNLLFAGTQKAGLKDQLDALSMIGTKFKDMQGYLNHSGTGGTNAVLGGLGAIAAAPLVGIPAVIKAAVGGNLIARWLARPANLKQVTQFSTIAYHALRNQAGAGTVQQALVQLATHIASDTGQDPRQVQARMQAAMQGAQR